jgi:hypothetical protein
MAVKLLRRIELSSSEIERILKMFIENGNKDAKEIKFVTPLEEVMTERVVVDLYEEVIKESKKEVEVKEKKKFVEPDIMIDDTVILIGITPEGKKIIKQYGNAWKLSTASQSEPPRYIMYSRVDSLQGKFAGEVSGKRSVDGVAVLTKDCNHPSRMFRVIGVCKFPKEFEWKLYWKAYEAKGIDIKSL